MREPKDVVRQITVAASAVVAVVGAFVGSGAAGGTPIQDAAGGALSATATPIAPAGPAFSIWSVIYLGLLAYAVWQLLPAQSSAERHRRLGYWVAASLLLNAAWILSVQFDQLWLSLPVIVALLAVLVRCFLLCLRLRPNGPVDAVVTDGTLGLYLGWVTIATAANATAVLDAAGFRGLGLPEDVWAVIVVAVAAVVGVLTAVRGRGRLAPAIGLAWGLAWVAVGRLAGELVSVPAGIAAATAVVVVLGAAVALRLREVSAA
ncbi:MAG TPA: TspO/MBR family protein [Rhodoglobus sp.]|nr:TspO/MBR family protein [Rhodoglobus sp.]